MNRAKAFLISLRLADTVLSSRYSTRPLLTQVTHFSNFSPSFLFNDSLYAHQKLHFSSKPNSILELLLANDWSTELEQELENSRSVLTHETVIYIMKRLDKHPLKTWRFFNWVCENSECKPSSSTYSLMLRILVAKGSMQQFWIAIRKMKEQGFYMDKETYLTILGIFRKAKMSSDAVALSHFYETMMKENAMENVVNKVVSIILEAEWDANVDKELEEMKLLLSDNFVIKVLKELRNCPAKAFRFFHWVGQCSGYGHNTVTYNAIARVLGRTDSIQEFWSVVEDMKGAGYEMDIDTYIKVSRHFQKYKMMEDAVKLYEFMMDSPYKPSAQDCSVLLRSISACNNPDMNLVYRVANKFEEQGNSLSKAAYDGIHRSLTRLGRFDEAEKIMRTMQNSGFEPDNVTYSQVVFGLCKAGRLEEACKVLDEMEANGCFPDIKTWTILIQGHCDANEVDKALICFAKMMEKNCDADADLLDVLINGFLQQRKIDGAYNLFMEMVDRARLRPWQATYKLLIEILLGARKLEEALNLLRLMKKQNHPAFAEPFVQYISKYGTVHDAADFLKALSLKDYPSSSAYVYIFKSFFQEGRHSEAKDLLYMCPHHIIKHPEICKLFGSADSSKAIA